MAAGATAAPTSLRMPRRFPRMHRSCPSTQRVQLTATVPMATAWMVFAATVHVACPVTPAWAARPKAKMAHALQRRIWRLVELDRSALAATALPAPKAIPAIPLILARRERFPARLEYPSASPTGTSKTELCALLDQAVRTVVSPPNQS